MCPGEADDGTVSKDGAARCHLDSRDTATVEHHEPVTMPATKHAGVLSKRCDDMVDQHIFVGDIRILVRDVHPVATGEPNA